MDIITSLSLLGYCLVLARTFKWRIETLPFWVVSLTIVLFYSFSFFHLLKMGSLFFIVIGILFLLSAPIYLHSEKGIFFENYVTPGLAIFIFYVIFFGILSHQLLVSTKDELARWLPHAKLLFLHHGFWGTENISDRDYPPGGALFYYLFSRFGGFSEGCLYFAQLLLLLSPLLISLNKSRWSLASQAWIYFSLLIMFLLILFRVKMGYSGSLMMDNCAGIFLGALLISYFYLNKIQYFWVYFLVPLGAFILLKPMLLPFVLLVATIVFCDQWLLLKSKNLKIKSFILLIFALVTPLLILFSWERFLGQIGIASQWGFSTLFARFIHSPIPNFTHAQWHTILINFTHSMIRPLIFCFGVVLLIYWLQRKISDHLERRRFFWIHTILILGYFTYLSLLTFIYLYQMPTAVTLAMDSFERFAIIYCLGWFLLLCYQTASVLNSENRVFDKLTQSYGQRASLLIGGALVLSIPFYLHQQTEIRKKFAEKRSWSYVHSTLEELAEKINAITPNNSKIRFLWTGALNSWYEQLILGYELYPRKVEFTYLSQGDFGARKNFNSSFKAYDYLLVGNINPYFLTRYGSLFDNFNEKPVTRISLCTDEKFDKPEIKDCRIKTIPIYLYKVDNQKRKLIKES